ncbi:WAS/WASL-interacting protein family member 3-like [Cydia fagiglandana]|uniref:WAS/WASL-interacting protein family member 3-like n=1 Tax=Cydia fagiglandana TaxID=1458189 RepID=UPI002FEE0E5D
MQNARGLIREIEPAAVSTESARPVPRGPRRSLAAVPPPPIPPPTPPTPTPVNAEPAVDELDIMQLPIVFADDEPAPAPAPPLQRHAAPTPAARTPSVTVTSGHPRGGRALNYTRVIVAKRRGARGPAPPRPVLLRRTVRLLRDN